MKEHEGKRIIVLSPDMMANMFMSSYKNNLTYYDEITEEKKDTSGKVQSYKMYNSSTVPHKEKKLRRTKKKSPR